MPYVPAGAVFVRPTHGPDPGMHVAHPGNEPARRERAGSAVRVFPSRCRGLSHAAFVVPLREAHDHGVTKVRAVDFVQVQHESGRFWQAASAPRSPA